MTAPTDTRQRPTVWDDESGERCFIQGHLRPERHAIAAANRWARVDCGLVNLFDDKADAAHWREWITVEYRWLRPDPQCAGDDETGAWCDEGHPQAEPVTVVSW